MANKLDKTIWRRLGIIAVLIPVSLAFSYVWFGVLFIAWTLWEDLTSPRVEGAPPRTWVTATPEDDDWLALFIRGCESPAESAFLKAMVSEFCLLPNEGKLLAPGISLAMQVKFQQYRFDFVINNIFIVEIDGATYHSSPEAVERDRIRDEFSLAHGFKVLRIPASVVFITPFKAVQQVKQFALEPIAAQSIQIVSKDPVALSGVKRKPIEHYLKSLKGGIFSITEGVSELAKQIGDASVHQAAIGDFRSAISLERYYMESMVKKTEHRIWEANLDPEQRAFAQDLRNKLTEGETLRPLSDAFKWARIIYPNTVTDPLIQQKIVSECESLFLARNQMFSEIVDRCIKDPVFGKVFRELMEESKFPYMHLVHPIRPRLSFRALLNDYSHQAENDGASDLK
ncbi:endonuclease domain-containing protein [Pseudomonas sp. efr-133-TYG-103a]|uniref:endonuclease domain-containing protein n=1 Tax=Pseudomonas sp. efr-133-TYG-103a TaxID=3040308 RepID=UPI002555AD7B|nr:DUF559 domain-containing protein [Pseudomonas sp. efr-133-TYG-103a]